CSAGPSTLELEGCTRRWALFWKECGVRNVFAAAPTTMSSAMDCSRRSGNSAGGSSRRARLSKEGTMDINRLLQNLTREEKIALVSGSDQWHTAPIPRLGIPAIMMSDGPHGLRKQEMTGDNMGLGDSVPATCFPT